MCLLSLARPATPMVMRQMLASCAACSHLHVAAKDEHHAALTPTSATRYSRGSAAFIHELSDMFCEEERGERPGADLQGIWPLWSSFMVAHTRPPQHLSLQQMDNAVWNKSTCISRASYEGLLQPAKAHNTGVFRGTMNIRLHVSMSCEFGCGLKAIGSSVTRCTCHAGSSQARCCSMMFILNALCKVVSAHSCACNSNSC